MSFLSRLNPILTDNRYSSPLTDTRYSSPITDTHHKPITDTHHKIHHKIHVISIIFDPVLFSIRIESDLAKRAHMRWAEGLQVGSLVTITD